MTSLRLTASSPTLPLRTNVQRRPQETRHSIVPQASSTGLTASSPTLPSLRRNQRLQETRRSIVPHASPKDQEKRIDERFENDVYLKMRSEAESPFRSVRLVLFGFSAISAGVGFIISIPQLIGALGGAGGATVNTQEGLINFGVDLGALLLFAYLTKGELDTRAKQMARLEREETLGALPLEIATGSGPATKLKRARLSDLRGFSRIVICAGTKDQVAAMLDKAAPLRSELQKRGVSVVVLPVMEGEGGSAGQQAVAELREAWLGKVPGAEEGGAAGGEEEGRKELELARRWLLYPRKLDEWSVWLDKQMALANVTRERAREAGGLYLSLRIDGRIRGSGVGPAPWSILAAQLPPTEGAFKGFLDGMDGRISSFD